MGKNKRSNNSSNRGGDNTASSENASNRRGSVGASSDVKRGETSNLENESTMRQPQSSSTGESTSSWKKFALGIYAERQGIIWVLGCVILGGILGFGIGSGILTGASEATPWRIELGNRIRSTSLYRMCTLQEVPIRIIVNGVNVFEGAQPVPPERLFAVLREAIIREPGGFVHPDLGIMIPAPSGASRGVGMVRDSYQTCQTKCLPGVASEKLALKQQQKSTTNETIPPTTYKQEEILMRIPLNFQMTRNLALETLIPLLPEKVLVKNNLHELDDAALLILLLAHERGVGRHSRWLPYIASLPEEPQCGFSHNLRPHALDAINALRDELGVDVYGWAAELVQASQHAQRVVAGLTNDYGFFIANPPFIKASSNIQWALCQVTSRATAGDEKYGSLRLVPMLDMVNHDASAGGFVELTGEESLEGGDFIDAKESDAGTFVIRSVRHGRRKALKKGQELLANYNVPHYSPLDWFVSLGFVPPERWQKWQKVDAALPRVRRDGPFGDDSVSSSQVWKERTPKVLAELQKYEL